MISNSDLGYKGNKQRKAPAGTIHGSVEQINGKYYVFYHRCTNNTDFSRQACAEPIEMINGEFVQTEVTTQGVGKPLKALGEYSAALCCNLYNSKTKNVQGNGHGDDQPNIAYRNGEHFVTAITDGTTVGFKYFDFDNPKYIEITVRGQGGSIKITTANGNAIASIIWEKSDGWKTYTVQLKQIKGVQSLFFTFTGKGQADFKSFTLS